MRLTRIFIMYEFCVWSSNGPVPCGDVFTAYYFQLLIFCSGCDWQLPVVFVDVVCRRGHLPLERLPFSHAMFALSQSAAGVTLPPLTANHRHGLGGFVGIRKTPFSSTSVPGADGLLADRPPLYRSNRL